MGGRVVEERLLGEPPDDADEEDKGEEDGTGVEGDRHV